MLNRDQIDERLAAVKRELKHDDLDDGEYCGLIYQREALETAQKLGEWVANADHGQDAVELLKARAWLRGEK